MRPLQSDAPDTPWAAYIGYVPHRPPPPAAHYPLPTSHFPLPPPNTLPPPSVLIRSAPARDPPPHPHGPAPRTTARRQDVPQDCLGPTARLVLRRRRRARAPPPLHRARAAGHRPGVHEEDQGIPPGSPDHHRAGGSPPLLRHRPDAAPVSRPGRGHARRET